MTGDPRRTLTHELTAFGRVRRRLRLASRACAWLTLALVISTAYVLVDVLFAPGAIPLLVFFALSALAILVLLAALVAGPLLSRVRPEREALAAESLIGTLRNRLITALQLAGREEQDAAAGLKLNVSPSLIAAVEDQAAEDILLHKPERLINRTDVNRRTITACVLLLLAIMFGILRDEVIAERCRRLQQAYLALMDMIWPVVVEVSPKSETVLRGSRVTLTFAVQGRPFEQATLHRLVTAEDESTTRSADRLALTQGAARFETEALQETFDYWFEYGERRTETYRIRVVDPPAIERVRMDLDYPPYTKRLPRTFMGRVPIIRTLEGTRVTVSVTYNKDIANAVAVWDSGAEEYWDLAGRYVGTEFIVANTDAVVMRAECVDGYSVRQPLRFSVIAEKDERPIIAAHVKTSREGSLMLTAEQLPLFSVGFTATDDFGVSAVELKYEKGGTDVDLASEKVEGSIPMVFQPTRDRIVSAFQKCFANLSVQPGDKITFYLEAKDNKDVEGGQPNIGRTARKYSIVIYQPRLTAFLDERMDAWGQGLRLWGGVERAGKISSVNMPPLARRVSKSPETEKQDLRSSVSAERIPGANRKAEAQFRELMARWREGQEEE